MDSSENEFEYDPLNWVMLFVDSVYVAVLQNYTMALGNFQKGLSSRTILALRCSAM